MTPLTCATCRAGGTARRLALCAAVALTVPIVGVMADETSRPAVLITKSDTGYSVRATFDVAAEPSTVRAVLTDYERIPEFMPQIRKSRLVAVRPDGATVEQEAVAELLMFSRRLHLRLDVSATADTISFCDVDARSFSRYEGVWRLAGHDGITTVDYDLTAKPLVEIPEWVLTRVMKRDAARMIDELRKEVLRRAATAAQ